MFIKEIMIYVDYLKSRIEETSRPWSEKQLEYFSSFRDNLDKGIQYYKELFTTVKANLKEKRDQLSAELEKYENQLKNLPIR
jgi:hypothetical protein